MAWVDIDESEAVKLLNAAAAKASDAASSPAVPSGGRWEDIPEDKARALIHQARTAAEPEPRPPTPQQLRDAFQAGLNAVSADTTLFENLPKGMAARGNQALVALNPFATAADEQRIAREQEWVRQNPGAGLGSMLGDMAITTPVSAIPGVGLGRALATGAIEALTRQGRAAERLENLALSTAGAGLGEAGSKALGFLAQPFKRAGNAFQPGLDRLAGKAQSIGMPLSAAQTTGNRALAVADSALDTLPTSSAMQAAKKTAQREAWQAAVLGKAGAPGARQATPEVMGALKNELSATYDDIAGRNNLVIDDEFISKLLAVRDKQLRRLPTNQKAIVKSYLDDLLFAASQGIESPTKNALVDMPVRSHMEMVRKIPSTTQIPGRTYQDLRSMLDKQARAFENSDPATAYALKSIRDAADEAFNRSVSKADAARLRETNRQWSVMRLIEKAADPVTGEISPNKFMSNLTRREKNRVLYGKGDQDLVDLARIGKQFVASKVPDSGTAQRAWWQNVLTGGAGLGIAGAGAYHAPLSTLALSAAALGLPPAASSLMWRPNSYPMKAAVELGTEVLPGITRQGLLGLLARPLGTQGAMDLGGN